MAKIDVEQKIAELSAQATTDSEALQALIDKFLADADAIIQPYVKSDMTFPQLAEQREVYDAVKMKDDMAKMRANMAPRKMPTIEE